MGTVKNKLPSVSTTATAKTTSPGTAVSNRDALAKTFISSEFPSEKETAGMSGRAEAPIDHECYITTHSGTRLVKASNMRAGRLPLNIRRVSDFYTKEVVEKEEALVLKREQFKWTLQMQIDPGNITNEMTLDNYRLHLKRKKNKITQTTVERIPPEQIDDSARKRQKKLRSTSDLYASTRKLEFVQDEMLMSAKEKEETLDDWLIKFSTTKRVNCEDSNSGGHVFKRKRVTIGAVGNKELGPETTGASSKATNWAKESSTAVVKCEGDNCEMSIHEAHKIELPKNLQNGNIQSKSSLNDTLLCRCAKPTVRNSELQTSFLDVTSGEAAPSLILAELSLPQCGSIPDQLSQTELKPVQLPESSAVPTFSLKSYVKHASLSSREEGTKSQVGSTQAENCLPMSADSTSSETVVLTDDMSELTILLSDDSQRTAILENNQSQSTSLLCDGLLQPASSMELTKQLDLKLQTKGDELKPCPEAECMHELSQEANTCLQDSGYTNNSSTETAIILSDDDNIVSLVYQEEELESNVNSVSTLDPKSNSVTLPTDVQVDLSHDRTEAKMDSEICETTEELLEPSGVSDADEVKCVMEALRAGLSCNDGEAVAAAQEIATRRTFDKLAPNFVVKGPSLHNGGKEGGGIAVVVEPRFVTIEEVDSKNGHMVTDADRTSVSTKHVHDQDKSQLNLVHSMIWAMRPKSATPTNSHSLNFILIDDEAGPAHIREDNLDNYLADSNSKHSDKAAVTTSDGSACCVKDLKEQVQRLIISKGKEDATERLSTMSKIHYQELLDEELTRSEPVEANVVDLVTKDPDEIFVELRDSLFVSVAQDSTRVSEEGLPQQDKELDIVKASLSGSERKKAFEVSAIATATNSQKNRDASGVNSLYIDLAKGTTHDVRDDTPSRTMDILPADSMQTELELVEERISAFIDTWITPDDLVLDEDLGFTVDKLSGRTKETHRVKDAQRRVQELTHRKTVKGDRLLMSKGEIMSIKDDTVAMYKRLSERDLKTCREDADVMVRSVTRTGHEARDTMEKLVDVDQEIPLSQPRDESLCLEESPGVEMEQGTSKPEVDHNACIEASKKPIVVVGESTAEHNDVSQLSSERCTVAKSFGFEETFNFEMQDINYVCLKNSEELREDFEVNQRLEKCEVNEIDAETQFSPEEYLVERFPGSENLDSGKLGAEADTMMTEEDPAGISDRDDEATERDQFDNPGELPDVDVEGLLTSIPEADEQGDSFFEGPSKMPCNRKAISPRSQMQLLRASRPQSEKSPPFRTKLLKFHSNYHRQSQKAASKWVKRQSVIDDDSSATSADSLEPLEETPTNSDRREQQNQHPGSPPLSPPLQLIQKNSPTLDTPSPLEETPAIFISCGENFFAIGSPEHNKQPSLSRTPGIQQALLLNTEALPSNISPSNDVPLSTLKENSNGPPRCAASPDSSQKRSQSSPPLKSILKTETSSVPCQGSCNCSRCLPLSDHSKTAVEFIQSQMLYVERIAGALIGEMGNMRSMVEGEPKTSQAVGPSTLPSVSPKEASIPEPIGTLARAAKAEDWARKELLKMHRDSRRVCRIIGTGPRKITFADEAGRRLCHVKYFQTMKAWENQ